MKIGVLGLGSIGLRHAKNLITLGHKVSGYDPNISRSQMLVDAGGNGSTREEAITNVDAIIIASPTTNHLKDIRDSYNLNNIGVFVEKPISHIMANDIDWVDMIGFMLRFHPCVKKAKEWMDKGLIGYPQWANFTCGQFNDKPDYMRDGVILNWSHEIDLALYLLGSAKLIGASTRLSQGGYDDITDILLAHNILTSSIHLDYVTRPEVRQSIIVGSKATIIMDLVNRNAWLRGADGVMWDHLADDMGSFDDDYIEEMKAFIDRVEGKETIGATGEDGLRVLEICLEVRKQAGL